MTDPRIKEIMECELVDSEEDAEFILTLPPEALYLVHEDQALVGWDHQHDWPEGVKNPCEGKPHRKILCLLVSDTFAYASADVERIPLESLSEVVSIYKRFGYTGLVCWTAKQRNEDPVIEYTEDPEYQKTWTALYGDLKVQKNFCNTIDPRWSSRKLNIKPWQPK